MSELVVPERIVELEKLSLVRQELAVAKTLPEINKVIQQASAAQESALRAKQAMKALGWAEEVVRQCINVANEAGAISLDAQAKAGGVLRRMAENGERRGRGNPQFTQAGEIKPGAEELGLDDHDIDRWQQVERVPAEVRQDYVEQTKAAAGNVTRGGLLAHAEKTGQKSAVHLRAEEVVTQLLADGPMESKAFQAALKDQGVSEHGLRLARKSLGVTSERAGLGTIWKYADAVEEIPQLGQGWECPACGGWGWVEVKPKHRHPRGYERQKRRDYKKAYDQARREQNGA